MTDATGSPEGEGWTAFDLSILLRNRRVIAVLDISLGERNLSSGETGAQIARAFPELRDDAAAAAGSILPVQGLGHLTEIQKESLIRAAQGALYPPSSGYLAVGGRDEWSKDNLEQLLAIPRALAVAKIYGGSDGWSSMEEVLCRAFPFAYPNGCYRDLLPLSGLDHWSSRAVGELWDAAASAANGEGHPVPDDMQIRFPDVHDVRDIHTIAEVKGADCD